MCGKIDWGKPTRGPSTDASDRLHVVQQLSFCSDILTARDFCSVHVWIKQTVRLHRNVMSRPIDCAGHVNMNGSDLELLDYFGCVMHMHPR